MAEMTNQSPPPGQTGQPRKLTLEQVFSMAAEHQRAGRIKDAEPLYRTILQAVPDHAKSLHNLGVIAKQTGHLDAALDLIRKSLSHEPGSAEAYGSLGGAYSAMGRLEEAVAAYHRALEIRPDFPQILLNLGNALLSQEKPGLAAECLERTIELVPSIAEAHNSLAAIRVAQRRFAEAEESCKNALRIKPDFAEALNLLGLTSMERGNLEEAREYLDRALVLKPGLAEAHLNMGGLHQRAGRPEEAEAAYQRALGCKPDYAEALNNLGAVLLDLGRPHEAREHLKRALDLVPEFSKAQNNMGRVFLRTGDLDKALKYFDAAIATDENVAEFHNNRGALFMEMIPFDEAARCFKKAIELNPNIAELHSNLGNAMIRTGRPDEAVASYRRALEIRAVFAEARSNLIFALDFMPQTENADLMAERAAWNELHAKPLRDLRRPHANPPDPERRLRIGYVSADFRRHSAAYLFEPPLLHYDRKDFEAICYSNSLVEDDLTARFRQGADKWRPIVGINDSRAEEMIRADGIDILVDLSGHTKGNRLELFARKPAPILVTAWGHAVGTGVETMDVLFSDPVYMTEEDRKFCTETVFDLPCAVGYICPGEAPAVSPLPAAHNQAVTFGCLNKSVKISRDTLEAWGDILSAIPGSRLILKDSAYDGDGERGRMTEFFSRFGVDEDRITLLGHTHWREHMGTYGKIDIGLDPFPQSGGTSTLEALWMGVPMVTLKGTTLNGRVSASIMTAAGLPGWVAGTTDAYGEIAKEKARDLAALARLRQSMREKLAATPLGDPKRYAGAVGNAYRTLWRHWCADRDPSPSGL